MLEGHAVRGTTRTADRAAPIEEIGAEPFIGDPDRVATLAPAFEHVTIACLLLGTARGADQQLAALHGPRLEMMLTRMLDTTIRGVVYEAAGTVRGEDLASGASLVKVACEDARIPYELLSADPGAHAEWLTVAREAVARLL